MSQKKIDSRKVVAEIFGGAHGVRGRGRDEISLLIGQPQKKRSRVAGGRGIGWGGWENECGGIDVGYDSIKFVLLAQGRRRLRLKDVQVEKLVPLGEEEKPEEREKDMLTALLKVASRVKRKTKVAIALNDPSLYMDSLSVPRGSKEELRESVRKELSEKRLIDPASSFFDFADVNGGSGSAAAQELFVVAAPKDLVYRQFELVQSAGFRVLSIETNALAALQALKRVVRWESRDRVLILDVGFRHTNLSVMIGERFVFNRIIPIAGERFTKEIQKAFGLSFEEAEQLKIRHTLNVEPPPVASGGEASGGEISQGDKVSQILKLEIDKLLGEVERSLSFAFAKETAEEGIKLTSAFLIGGGARLSGFSHYLEQRLEVPVRDIDIWEGLAFNERSMERDFLIQTRDLAFTAFGLALWVTEWKVLPFGMGMPG